MCPSSDREESSNEIKVIIAWTCAANLRQIKCNNCTLFNSYRMFIVQYELWALARKIRTKISERGNISILYEKHAITSLLLERKNIIKLNRKIKTPNIVADSNVLLQNIILSLISMLLFWMHLRHQFISNVLFKVAVKIDFNFCCCFVLKCFLTSKACFACSFFLSLTRPLN